MPLSASQRTDLETQYNELKRKYQNLSEHIAALDTDIGRELDCERQLSLQERRDDLFSKREAVAEQMHRIEITLGKGQSHSPPQMNGAIPYSESGYFYTGEFLADLVECHDSSLLRDKDGFILYPEPLRPEIYAGQKRKIAYRRHGSDYVKEFPYHEVINFTEAPHTEIAIVGDIAHHVLRSDIEKLTTKAQDAFLAAKPGTDPAGKVLRMVYLKGLGNDKYQCCLEESLYGMQVRTNLTIDYPIELDSTGNSQRQKTSLRQLDLDTERRLKPLEQSVLVNSIGVSAVVYFRKGDIKYYFASYRPTQGVFSDVLGTLSCAVTVDDCYADNSGGQEQRKRVEPELIVPLKKALKRKFRQEVGLDPSVIIDIKPLAFDLELFRGGKPQFFFLIEIAEGIYPSSIRSELASSTIKFIEKIRRKDRDCRTAMSPEFVVNLLYAWRHFQVMDGISGDIVILP